MTAGRSNGLVLVIIAGLVVIGAGAAGWFLFNKSEPAVAEPVAEKPAEAPHITPSATSPAPKLDPTAEVKDTQEPPPKKELPTREYYVDGKLIRDHRPEGTPPIDLPPAIHPPDSRKMQPQSTGMITKAVKLVMRECVATIPPEERIGEKPKMEAVINIAVKDKTATVNKATIQLRDVRGSASDAAKSCIENKVLAVTEGVDEADLESYDITTSFLF
ncbi:MAG: hypothetical protein AB7L94_39935 [Kofleriaceae bacterium]